MRSTRRAPSTTVAPSDERCRAAASPRPLLAPVMTTTLPSMLLLMWESSIRHEFEPGGHRARHVQAIDGGSDLSTRPSHCVHPQPEVTIKVWPSGCVCQALRAPGSNVTLAHE